MLARQIAGLRARLMLAQNRDDLLFREPDPLHRPSLQWGRTLNRRGGKTQWQVSAWDHVQSLLQDSTASRPVGMAVNFIRWARRVEGDRAWGIA